MAIKAKSELKGTQLTII